MLYTLAERWQRCASNISRRQLATNQSTGDNHQGGLMAAGGAVRWRKWEFLF